MKGSGRKLLALKHKIMGTIEENLPQGFEFYRKFYIVECAGSSCWLKFRDPCASMATWDFVALEVAHHFGEVFYTVNFGDAGFIYTFTFGEKRLARLGPPSSKIHIEDVKPFVTAVGSAPFADYYIKREGDYLFVWKLYEEWKMTDALSSLLNNCLGGGSRAR